MSSTVLGVQVAGGRISIVQENRLLREVRARRAGMQTWPMLVPATLEVPADITESRIAAALGRVADRHEVLRTSFRFPETGEEVTQRIESRVTPPLSVRRYGQVTGQWRIEEASRVQQEMMAGPVPLTEAPLWRATALFFEDRPTILVLVFEHFIFDAHSQSVFAKDFARELDRTGGATGIGDALPRQYSEWAAWQQEMLSGDEGAEFLDFWRTHLAGTVPFPPLDLPPGDAGQPSQWAAVRLRLDADGRQAVSAVAQPLGLTLYMAFFAAVVDAWQAATGLDDMVIHSPCGNRTNDLSQEIIGWFAHSIPVRIRLDSTDRGAAFLKMIRREVLVTSSYQDVPLPALTRALQPDSHGRARRRQRLYLSYLPKATPEWELTTGGTVRLIELPEPDPESESDLSIIIQDGAAGTTISVEFDPQDIAADFVDRFAETLCGSLSKLYSVTAVR